MQIAFYSQKSIGDTLYRYNDKYKSVLSYEIETLIANKDGITYKAMRYIGNNATYLVEIPEKLIGITYFDRPSDANGNKNLLMGDEAYTALYKILSVSKMDTWCALCFDGDKYDGVYICDIESGATLPLANGLSIVKQGMTHIDDYGLSDAEKTAFYETLIINGITI